MFMSVKDDCTSFTGSNLRLIMLRVGHKCNIDELTPSDSKLIKYKLIPNEEKWRVSMVNEITDAKFGQAEIPGFTKEELEAILEFVCTS